MTFWATVVATVDAPVGMPSLSFPDGTKAIRQFTQVFLIFWRRKPHAFSMYFMVAVILFVLVNTKLFHGSSSWREIIFFGWNRISGAILSFDVLNAQFAAAILSHCLSCLIDDFGLRTSDEACALTVVRD